MTFKTQFNANEFPKQWEKGGGISKTIPDQSLTVPQIMERNRRGLSIPQAKNLEYTHDDQGEALVPGADLPDLAKLDLAEIQQLKAQASDQVQQLQLQLQQENLEKEQKALEEKVKQMAAAQATPAPAGNPV